MEAYVQADSGVHDLSPYIVRGSVSRAIDQVSSAELTLRNPNLMFTEAPRVSGDPGPILHPMDPIIVTLTRIKNRPIQVFTGYLDTTPYLQLFPGTITLKATCTLKRLMYTYVDPGLPFFNEWLTLHGWQTVEGIGIVSPSATKDSFQNTGKLEDSSFGKLLFAFLTEIGGWDENNVFIEDLPPALPSIVAALFTRAKAQGEQAQQELDDLLHKIIGSASLGNGLPGGGPAHQGQGTAAGGGWFRVGATLDSTRGQAPTFSDHNGMSFAELLQAGENRGLHPTLTQVLSLKSSTYGMDMGTAIQIRMPGGTTAHTIYKNDVGSGQPGSPHYKIDLHAGIAGKLGWKPNEDVEVRVPA